MTQAHIFYSGTVQGVGFRYAAKSYAGDLDLKGWVRNLGDGRVEIVAEGPEERIKELCGSLDRHFQGYIRSVEVHHRPPSNDFTDFKII